MRNGTVADVYRASNADGAAVIRWPDTGASNQQWAFRSTGMGAYHTIACVRSGKVLDKAVLGGGGRGGRTDDRRRPDEPAVAAARAGRGRVRPGRPQQGVNDQAIALSSSKGARCLPSSADGACCK
ncbi:RICIN domain-containing protein [Streptomyces glaucescens]|uniref:RICIN domain-containing protein n=1 Tax=Streptomyces glaucescens TaxID=1907 RepID=UPI001FE3A167|nr:RICIN domain-containing protein [Streptomyces glaucescens]